MATAQEVEHQQQQQQHQVLHDDSLSPLVSQPPSAVPSAAVTARRPEQLDSAGNSVYGGGTPGDATPGSAYDLFSLPPSGVATNGFTTPDALARVEMDMVASNGELGPLHQPDMPRGSASNVSWPLSTRCTSPKN